MKHRLRVAVAALGLLVVTAGCGSSGGSNSTPPPASDAPTTPSAVASNMASSGTAATSPLDTGAVTNTSVAHVTNLNGYRADITITWHQSVRMSPSLLTQTCSSYTPDANTVYLVTVADVTSSFPSVNGMQPSTDGFSFTPQYDSSVQSFCSDAPSWNLATVAPASSNPGTMHVLWVNTSEKTPNEPNGIFFAPKVPTELNINYLEDSSTSSCTGKGITTSCQSLYGGSGS